MLVHSAVGLDCRLVVLGHTSTVLDLCRVVEVVADGCCMLEDIIYFRTS